MSDAWADRGRTWQSARCDANLIGMYEGKRLGDPGFEPTDEDLEGISKRAFAHVRSAREESLRKMREEIAAARKSALEGLRTRWPEFKAPR